MGFKDFKRKVKKKVRKYAFRKIRRIITVYIEFRIFRSVLRRIKKKL